ncbi:MAG: hypothetical protein WC254_01550 [Candidatus Woesearchaeota archaeon]|jgi:hypothetical protein
MHKKGALNLSVEAIIIFVLAFAMLGVGIFITDQVREMGTGGLSKANEILASIEENPSADKPIVGISSKSDFTLPAKDQMVFAIKYYNSGRQVQTEATVLIDGCISSSTKETISYESSGEYPVSVVTAPVDVEPSSEAEFPMIVENVGLTTGEKYICKLEIVQSSDPANVYESLNFLLTVAS